MAMMFTLSSFTKGGYVLVVLVLSVCLFVCLSVSEQHYSRTYNGIVMYFYGGVQGCTINN